MKINQEERCHQVTEERFEVFYSPELSFGGGGKDRRSFASVNLQNVAKRFVHDILLGNLMF